MAEIINKEQAVAAAQRVVESQRTQSEQRKFEFEKYMKALAEVDPNIGGFDELGALLAMPEEHFAIIAPVFLAELEKGLKNVNDQMIMVQTMNLAGLKAENVREQYEQIYNEIDQQMSEIGRAHV